MSHPYDIMVAGHVCLDLIPEFLPSSGPNEILTIFNPGKLIHTGKCKISTGGPVSNTGIGLQILGHNVCFCARVGDDELGKITYGHLKEYGNISGIKSVKGSASSYTIVLAPPGIDRIFLHHPGTNDAFGLADLDLGLLKQCRHFHFGYPPLMRRMYEKEGNELQQIFKLAKEAGAITSCDMALPDPTSASGAAPWLKILEHVLPYIDLYLPSLEETFFMLEPDSFLKMKKAIKDTELIFHLELEDYSRLAGKLIQMGAKMVALKAGERGFYFRTAPDQSLSEFGKSADLNLDNWANRELFCPAFVAPQVASATGSGDSSIAGFLAAFSRKFSVEWCLKYACLVGWLNVQELDAISGLKSWPLTESILKRGLPFHTLTWENRHWTWNETYHLWSGADDPLHQ